MKTILFIFLSSLPCAAASAQTGPWQISGRVFSDTGEPLAGATVTVDENAQDATDLAGAFAFSLPARPVRLLVRRLGYFPQRLRLDTLSYRNRTARLQVFLTPRETALPEVNISGKSIESLFEEDFRTNLLDYSFLGKDLLLLLQDGKKSLLRLEDDTGKPRSELRLPNGSAGLLHQSCTGDLHAVGTALAWEITLRDGALDTLPHYTAAQFYKLVEPCVAELNEYYFFRQRGTFNQSVDYFYFDPERKRHPLAFIYDEAGYNELMTRYHQILAAYMQSVDAFEYEDIVSGKSPLGDPSRVTPQDMVKMAETNKLIAAIGFFNTLASDSLYAPLLKLGDRLLLLDHQNDQLRRISTKPWGETSVGLRYHRYPGWRKEVLVDAVLGRVYGRFSTWGGQLILREINPDTGEAGKEYKPEVAPYLADNFQTRNGYLYFIGQPDVNTPNRKLYKVNLLKFGSP